MNNYHLQILTQTIIILLFIISLSSGQNLLDGPESVAYDSINNRYLVSSLRNNKIISIDSDGNQSLFKESIVSFGNCIKDSTLYVTGNATIRGLHISTAADVFSVTVPGVLQFDGITADDSGYLYALATRGEVVYKIDIETNNYWAYVDSGFGTAPQDLIYDKYKNRILVCQWHTNSSILAISLEDSALTTVAENSAGFADGITIDQHGNIYVPSYSGEGEIYKYDNDFSNPGELIYVGIEEPAGLDYNIVDDILAVPSFSGDRVEFIKMPPIYLFPEVGFNLTTGHAPLSIQFIDLSSSNPKINNWEWDFDNDGSIDSYEQNPTWIFNEPGIYKFKTNFFSDSLTNNYEQPDSIMVFNGESSIQFIDNNSIIKINPSIELEMNDEWTFDAWIKPTSLHGKYILDKHSIQVLTNRRSSGFNDNSLIIKFVREDGTTIRFSTEDSSLTLDSWQHIAVTYSYSNKLFYVYINGDGQEISIEKSTIFDSPLIDNSTDTLLLGNNLSLLRSLKGNLDEVRLWNQYRSKEQIDQYRYDYLSGNEDGLIGYWKMNEGNGDTIFDSSVKNNYGIVDNSSYSFGIDYDSLVGVKDIEGRGGIPNNFNLSQNYPNPFNPSTTFSFSIPKKDFVTLSIYNSLGELVDKVINKVMQFGTYEIIWNGKDLTSGVYFARLTAGANVQVRKIMLLK
jgi:PKD repeat protein